MNDELFKNKYRIESTRLPGWDYTNDGYYFITVCTKDREMFFGNVIDGKMILNDVGKIVAEEWSKTPQIRKNVMLGEFIVMPNHIHGIIIIDNGNNQGGDLFLGINNFLAWKYWGMGDVSDTVDECFANNALPTIVETPQRVVSTINNVTSCRDEAVPRLYAGEYPHMSEISPKPNSLGAIINQIKSICTKRIHKINLYFDWQERFYDHIIRNEQSLFNIQQYIINNPLMWYQDRNNFENLWM